MKALIVFDSFFGNTEQVARAVGEALSQKDEATVARVSEVKPEHLLGIDLLVVGSPTRAFRPSEDTQAFLKGLAAQSLQGIRTAAFDTRINPDDTNSGFVRLVMRLFGYAAEPIARGLTSKGGALTGEPEGFYVEDKEGPLKDGELERARDWARGLL